MGSRRGSLETGRRRRSVGVRRLAGLVLLTALVGLLAWVGYEFWVSNAVAEVSYRQQAEELRASWQVPAPAARQPDHGDAFALLRIPAFGDDYEVPVLAGTDLEVLSHGVGHYPATALPGQLGNFAVTGHRVTHGQPFARLRELGQGDAIVVETRSAIFTYLLDVPPKDVTVQPDASWVLDPVPGEKTVKPSSALLTLTTGQDVLPTSDRSVGFGHLASAQNKG